MWTGKRVLRRSDADGTAWTIRACRCGMLGAPDCVTMILEVKRIGLRARSHHVDVPAAQRHADLMSSSMVSSTLAKFQEAVVSSAPVVDEDQIGIGDA